MDGVSTCHDAGGSRIGALAAAIKASSTELGVGLTDMGNSTCIGSLFASGSVGGSPFPSSVLIGGGSKTPGGGKSTGAASSGVIRSTQPLEVGNDSSCRAAGKLSAIASEDSDMGVAGDSASDFADACSKNSGA